MTRAKKLCASHYDAVVSEYPDADMSRLPRGRRCGRCAFCAARVFCAANRTRSRLLRAEARRLERGQ